MVNLGECAPAILGPLDGPGECRRDPARRPRRIQSDAIPKSLTSRLFNEPDKTGVPDGHWQGLTADDYSAWYPIRLLGGRPKSTGLRRGYSCGRRAAAASSRDFCVESWIGTPTTRSTKRPRLHSSHQYKHGGGSRCGRRREAGPSGDGCQERGLDPDHASFVTELRRIPRRGRWRRDEEPLIRPRRMPT